MQITFYDIFLAELVDRMSFQMNRALTIVIKTHSLSRDSGKDDPKRNSLAEKARQAI